MARLGEVSHLAHESSGLASDGDRPQASDNRKCLGGSEYLTAPSPDMKSSRPLIQLSGQLVVMQS